MVETKESVDEILRKVGHDSTSTFDDGPSNPTEHAGSESMSSVAAPEDEDLLEDDDAAELEDDDEEDEDEDVEDEA